MDDNTFQEQLDVFFGGTTGTALGPDVITSSLQETKSDRWKIAYTPSTQFRGIDMGATPIVSNTAFLDFNSLDGGTADYDTRLLSQGGEAGYNGRGTLAIVADRFQFIGNTQNTTPYIQLPSGINYIGGASVYHAPTNQGRLHSVRQVVWSGNLATSNPDPSIVISLQDIETGVALSGHYTITMSNGQSGTGASIAYYSWSITRSNVGDPWQAAIGFASEDTPASLYANAILNNSSYASIRLYNKTADSARYLISGFVYYDTSL